MGWRLDYLSLFESDRTHIGFLQAASHPTPLTIILLLLPLLVFFSFHHIKATRSGGAKRKWAIFWGILSVWFLLQEGILRSTLGSRQTVVLVAVAVLLQTYFFLLRRPGTGSGPHRRIIDVAAATSVAIVALMGIFQFCVSTTPFLPASYPRDVADQLRMVNRIVMAQRRSLKSNTEFCRLSRLSVMWNGRELIPFSVRTEGKYKGYLYTLVLNQPKEGFLVLDATPLQYSPGMPSFHAYPVSLEVYDWRPASEVEYTITMADRRGKAARAEDRPFCRRYLHELLAQWLHGSR